MKPLQVYAYANCSTCRKALKWLDDHAIAHEVIDIVTRPPSKAMLRKIVDDGHVALKKLFNTSGQSYRQGNFGTRLPAMSDDEALAALAADGKLIKRPLVLGSDVTLVGFQAEQYAHALDR